MSMSKIKNHPNGGPLKERCEFSQTERRGGTRASDAGHGFLASAIYPLSLWRTLRADEFEASDLAAIRGLLANTVLLGQPKWRGAVAGDVPSAVAVAVSFMPVNKITVQVDIAMTALIRCAAEGDFAAAIVAANILRNLPAAMRLHRRIATSWFVSNLTTLRVMTGNGRSPAKPGVSPGVGRQGDEAAGIQTRGAEGNQASADANAERRGPTLQPEPARFGALW
jgi:hypothetical protein